MDKQHILIIDDEEDIRFMLRLHLERAGYQVTTASNVVEARTSLREASIDCVLSDLVMPGGSGLELLDLMPDEHSTCPFVLMSAHADIETALAAIERGAFDFVSKPFKAEEILFRIRRALEQSQMSKRLKALEVALDEQTSFGGIIARSAPMKSVFRTIEKVKNFQTTVLITGESGTGKELVARALHEQGQRSRAPFIAINCGAIPAALLESELFGHVKGAFTDAARDRRGMFQEAHEGTLFLDEIGELPLQLQVKLLRAVQEKEIRPVGSSQAIPVNVRVIAATMRNLSDEVAAGRFRQDLFYRLNVLPIQLPPLRERPADIPLLVEYFLARLGPELNTQSMDVSAAAMKMLTHYQWPGNVRELENLMERMLVLSDGPSITVDDLPTAVRQSQPKTTYPLAEDELSIKKTVRHVEEQLIKRALIATGGNRTKASKLLEISHRALLYKMKDYGVN